MNGGMRIAFVNNFAGPTLGGGEVQLLALVGGLVERGVGIAVACAGDSALESALLRRGDCTVVPVGFGLGALPALPSELAKAFAGVDVVQGTGFLTDLIARRVGRRLSVPVVNAIQVVPGAAALDGERRAKTAVRELLDRHLRGRVARFVVPSRAVADGLIARGVQTASIALVPNGVDVDGVRSMAQGDIGVTVPTGRPRIGYAGRLARVKGCEYFVRAAAVLGEKYPDAVFPVAGAGPEEPGLRRVAAELGLGGRVAFLGFVPNAPAFLRTLDAVVVPSLSEAFGLTVLEAQLLGVPVVASRVGGLEDLITDGDTGLLVPPADPPAIAEAVSRLIDDPARAATIARAGSRHAEACFGLDAMVEGYLAVYRDLSGTNS